MVTEEFFQTLGVPLHMGSGFAEDDFLTMSDSYEGRVIVGYDLWTNVFGADPKLLGGNLFNTEGPVPVAGIARPGFDYPEGASLWLTMPHSPAGTGHAFQGVARIDGSVPAERIQSGGGAKWLARSTWRIRFESLPTDSWGSPENRSTSGIGSSLGIRFRA